MRERPSEGAAVTTESLPVRSLRRRASGHHSGAGWAGSGYVEMIGLLRRTTTGCERLPRRRLVMFVPTTWRVVNVVPASSVTVIARSVQPSLMTSSRLVLDWAFVSMLVVVFLVVRMPA